MQLNETAAKMDTQLDSVCRKIERIEKDTRGDREQGELTYRPNHQGPGSKFRASSRAKSHPPILPLSV